MNAVSHPKQTLKPNFIAAVPVIPTPDVAASVAFYEHALNFETWLWDEPPTYGAIRRDGVELHFQLETDPSVYENSVCRIHLRSITPLYRQSRHAGILIGGGGLIEQPWGYLEFTVQDPFGARVIFGQDLDPPAASPAPPAAPEATDPIA